MFEKIKRVWKEYWGKGYEGIHVPQEIEFPQELTITDLVRHQLKGVNLEFANDEDAVEGLMKEGEKKALYADGHRLSTDKQLIRIIDHLINLQGNYSMKEAEIMDHVSFGRATINGLSLLKEELERLSNLHKELNERSEEFDRNDMI